MNIANQLEKTMSGYLGHKSLRASGNSRFIHIRIPLSKTDNPFKVGAPLVFSAPAIPVEFRERALKSIYGADWSSIPGREGNAGNVNGYSIAMSFSEWNETLLAFNLTPLTVGETPVS